MAKKPFPRHLSSYAWEKSYTAVRGMAASEKPVQIRIGEAYILHLSHIRQENVSSSIWKRLQSLSKTLTRYHAVDDAGTIAATVGRMNLEEAKDHANEITEIYWAICQLHLGSQD